MKRTLHRVRGFTLVEVMIALAIGLVIVLALITLLINMNRSNSELTRTNRLIENGRFSLQLLEADISHAGYWGGFVPQFDDMATSGDANDVPTGVPDPCLAVGTWDANYVNQLIGIPLQVYGHPVPVCAGIVTSPQANTDVLFVRHVDTGNPAAGGDSCVPGVGACPVENEVYFQRSNCSGQTPPSILSLAPTGTPAAPFTLNTRSCAATPPVLQPEVVRKFVSNMYYVRSYANVAGDGIPTLMRATFSGGAFQGAQAMVEGIEGFRVELGVDNVSKTGVALTTAHFNTTTGVAPAIVWLNPALLKDPTNRGDGNPDSYVHCTTGAPCDAFTLMNVVSAKIYVLARSPEKSAGYTDKKQYTLGSTTLGPFDDSYKRHLFTQTVRLTNVSMRREVPN